MINTSIYGQLSHLYPLLFPLESTRSSSLTNNYPHTPTTQNNAAPIPTPSWSASYQEKWLQIPSKKKKKNILVGEYSSYIAATESEIKWARRSL